MFIKKKFVFFKSSAVLTVDAGGIQLVGQGSLGEGKHFVNQAIVRQN